MNIILGGTGHIGSALASELLKNKISVTIVSRNADKAKDLEAAGAIMANVDVNNTEALRNIFLGGERLFLLNPPAMPYTDTVTEERKTLHSILKAIDGSGITKVVAASTYGARPGTGQGDLNVLFEMEQKLDKKKISASIIRSAYYMSNWDGYLQEVIRSGTIPSFYPANFPLPMVAPQDIGQFAAQLMMHTNNRASRQLYHIEGPQLYTPADVAEAFSKALGIPVQVIEIPEAKWKETFRNSGFSNEAANSYAAMTKVTLETDHTRLTEQIKGRTSLEDYVRRLVNT